MDVEDHSPLIRGKIYIILISIILSLVVPRSVYVSELVDGYPLPQPESTWTTETIKAPLLIVAKEFAPEIKITNLRSYGNGSCVPYARYKTGIQLTGWAATFLERASALGYATSTIPAQGGMVITDESRGHVAVVEEVKEDTIFISEQNYKGLHIVSTRELSLSDPRILVYIHD